MKVLLIEPGYKAPLICFFSSLAAEICFHAFPHFLPGADLPLYFERKLQAKGTAKEGQEAPMISGSLPGSDNMDMCWSKNQLSNRLR